MDDLSPERERTAVPTVWRHGFKTEEEFQKFLVDLQNSGFVLEKLKEVIRSKYRQTKADYADYDSPSWAYKAAATNGYRQALEDIMNLLP